jgi:aminoglycoside phosphotransferase (APT) family kinase protein
LDRPPPGVNVLSRPPPPSCDDGRVQTVPGAELTKRAIAAALRVAEAHGVECGSGPSHGPLVLSDRSNVLVHLRPHPLVARIATTTLGLRRGAIAWLAREVGVAAHLVACGVPAVAPSDLVPPGPHEQDGLPISFWRYVPHTTDVTPDPRDLARSLAKVHAALRSYTGDLPPLQGAFDEVLRGINVLEQWGSIAKDDADRLRAAQARVTEHLATPGVEVQPIHGDAHGGNVLVARTELVWNDFEDVCLGPIAWDVACLTRRLAGTEALAAYGPSPRQDELAPFIEARELQATVWSWIIARRFPEYLEAAEMRLHLFRARG